LLSLFVLTPRTPVSPANEVTNNMTLRAPCSDSIPSDVVLSSVNYSVTNTPESFDGYNLFLLTEYDLFLGTSQNVLIMMDMNGNVVTEKQLDSALNYDCPVEFIDPHTILLGTEKGATIWHIETDSLEYIGFSGHHEYEYNPNNNTIFTFTRSYENIDGVDYAFDIIEEHSMDGSLVWSWNVSDFISKDWWCPYNDTLGPYRDITHSNTIYYDADEDIIYYNSRHINTFYKLNHTSKEVIWGLGEHGNFTLYDLQGNQCNNLFYHAHSVEPIDDNKFILFDNDYHNQTDEYDQISRMVEIEINETTMTANESWYYEASPEHFSKGWGDANRLPNGNRVGVWGYASILSNATSASLIEVNENHDVVWETDFNYDSRFIYGIYRMERFRYTPILSSPDDIVSSNTTIRLSWDVWYDYRNKETLPGNYTLYIDGATTQEGLFNYTKYWQPTSITIDTGFISSGTHNVTLEVDDGFRNKVSDTVNVTVSGFHIMRTGLSTIETGQTESLPTWYGYTTSNLLYNITLNSTLFEQLNWTGQNIVLSPAEINLGRYAVHFQLFNGSRLVYEDSFWLQVDPMAPPVIVPMQTSALTLTEGGTLFLVWELSDSTPNNWTILVNDAETSGDVWTLSPYILNWSVPAYPHGTYNLTLVATDLLGNWSKSESILTIIPSKLPQFLSVPQDRAIAWGIEGVSFEWATYNAESWVLRRNGTQYSNGNATSGHISIEISNWRTDEWRPSTYNLTMVLLNDNYSVADTLWLAIVADPGDPYADAVVSDRSEFYLQGENALGAPDGLFSTIYMGYANGYLTLDMGENEEIIDGAGNDFVIYASGGNYTVAVSNSLAITFTIIGTGGGNQTFDLSSSGLSEARFVKITYFDGADIEFDAIEAAHFNTPPSDTTPPTLVLEEGLYTLQKGLNSTLVWVASDETPWSYEIYVNSTLVSNNYWNGSNIEYFFEPATTGLWNVTLVVYDAFGNVAFDTVMIEVYEPSTPSNGDLSLLIGILSFGLGVIVVIAIWIKKRK
jgi:hypothetical protein